MIILTQTGDRGNCLVAPDHISAILPQREQSSATCLLLSGGQELFVRESVEQVRAAMRDVEALNYRRSA